MSSYKKRYAVLQDEKFKKAQVIDAKSITKASDSATGTTNEDQSVLEGIYAEAYQKPFAEISSSGDGGDMSVSASGTVYETREAEPDTETTSNIKSVPKNKKTYGDGLIINDGSGEVARHSFKKGESDSYQMRTTPNYFDRAPFTLAYDHDTNVSATKSYSRPSILSLSNGNMLSVYLNSARTPWSWSFEGGLLSVTQSSIANFSPASISGGTITVPANQWNDSYFVPGYYIYKSPNYYEILTSASYNSNMAAHTITVDTKGSTLSTGPYNVYSATRARNYPADNPANNVKMRLGLHRDGLWSEENTVYPLLSDLSFQEEQFNAGFGATGIDLVQFKDTDEVLCIYCGYVGSVGFVPNNPCYLSVDIISDASNFDDYEFFASRLNNYSSVKNRSISSLSKYEGYLTQGSTSDIKNFEDNQTLPLDLAAEVLPSGRLVVVVAFGDKLMSFISDDRGSTFSANQIIDLTFGAEKNSELQQFASVDTVVTKSGSIAVLLVANPLGDRAFSDTEPSATDLNKESVVSIFVSNDGVQWSSEKKLGGGSHQSTYGQSIDSDEPLNYPYKYVSYPDESIYPLSGSICMTPEGFYLVSVCTLNIGGPGNQQGMHLYQRVLSTDELTTQKTGLEIAPSIPGEIYSSTNPISASISRFSPAIKYVGTRRDNPYSNNPIFQDYFLKTYGAVNNNNAPSYGALDSGWLGAAYFAGVKLDSGGLPHRRFGAGPIQPQGAIDVATTLHNGRIVTVICDLWMNRSTDFPHSSECQRGRTSAVGVLIRSVNVLSSASFQPLRVNIPTELNSWDGAYDVAGRLISKRADAFKASSDGGFRLLIYKESTTDETTQDFVNSSSPYIDVIPNAIGQNAIVDVGTINYTGSGLNRRKVYATWSEVGDGFYIDSITLQSNPKRYRIVLDPIGSSSVLSLFDGDPMYILPRSGVNLADEKRCGQIFGSNSWQLSRLGAGSAEYWGWQDTKTSGASIVNVEEIDGGASMGINHELTAGTTGTSQANYKFDYDFSSTSAYGLYSFPNSDGDFLKSDGDLGGHYTSGTKDSLSFVSRLVVQLQYGGAPLTNPTAVGIVTPEDRFRISAQVYLRDSDTSKIINIVCAMSDEYSSGRARFRLYEVRWGGQPNYYPLGDSIEIDVPSYVTTGDDGAKQPDFEIIWGVKPGLSAGSHAGFLFGRILDRHSDPDCLAGFVEAGAGSTGMGITHNLVSPIDGSAFNANSKANGTDEFFAYGIFPANSNSYDAKVSFKAVQFSRSFLRDEPCFAEIYEDSHSAGDAFSDGYEEFYETLHMSREPAFNFMRNYNGGVLAPMAPSLCGDVPQYVDNGIELSFRGRTSKNTIYEYCGKSSFPISSILESPVKDGWRSPKQTIMFNTDSRHESERLPSYEIVLDSGFENYINAEAISFFGINTGCIVADFSNSANVFKDRYGDDDSNPDLTMIFASPGHPMSLIYNYWSNSFLELDNPPANPDVNDTYAVSSTPGTGWTGSEDVFGSTYLRGSALEFHPSSMPLSQWNTITNGTVLTDNNGSTFVVQNKTTTEYQTLTYRQLFVTPFNFDSSGSIFDSGWSITFTSTNGMTSSIWATLVDDATVITDGGNNQWVKRLGKVRISFGVTYYTAYCTRVGHTSNFTTGTVSWTNQGQSFSQTVSLKSARENFRLRFVAGTAMTETQYNRIVTAVTSSLVSTNTAQSAFIYTSTEQCSAGNYTFRPVIKSSDSPSPNTTRYDVVLMVVSTAFYSPTDPSCPAPQPMSFNVRPPTEYVSNSGNVTWDGFTQSATPTSYRNDTIYRLSATATALQDIYATVLIAAAQSSGTELAYDTSSISCATVNPYRYTVRMKDAAHVFLESASNQTSDAKFDSTCPPVAPYTMSWQSGSTVPNGRIATYNGTSWQIRDPNDRESKRMTDGRVAVYDTSSWRVIFEDVPNMVWKPTYLQYFQNKSIRTGAADSGHSITYSVEGKRIYFTKPGSITQDPSSNAPFRPGQFKSQSNENFYVMLVDDSLVDEPIDTTYDHGYQHIADIRSIYSAKHCFYFKIVDNGSNYIDLDRSAGSAFGAGNLSDLSLTIISDRCASNTPDWRDNTNQGLETYRYMRITVTGGEHSDDHLKLGMSICGRRVDLSNPDIEIGYSYNLESGGSLFDSLSGRRRSRRRHKPRKSFDMSYNPRKSVGVDINRPLDNVSVSNTVRGYGNFYKSYADPAQRQEVSGASWQEVIERIMNFGIEGDVLALAFDGDNMETVGMSTGYVLANGDPQPPASQLYDVKPSVSDPHSIVPARLTGFGGAQNQAFTGQQTILNSTQGSIHVEGVDEVTNKKGCSPAAVMSIRGITFSEEL